MTQVSELPWYHATEITLIDKVFFLKPIILIDEEQSGPACALMQVNLTRLLLIKEEYSYLHVILVQKSHQG